MRDWKLVVVALALSAPSLYAQRITTLRADIDLRKDGSALVSEEVTTQGLPLLQRILRLEVASGNNSWYMDIRLLSVRDSTGNPLAYTTAVRDHHLEISVPLPPPLQQPKTVLLNYEVRHGVIVYFEANTASFDFNFTDDHQVPLPIEYVSVSAKLPDDPQGGLTAGLNGPSDPHVIIDGRRVDAWGRIVPPGYWLRLGLAFPSRILSLPARDWLHQEVGRMLVACLVLLALSSAWYTYRRSMANEVGALTAAHGGGIAPPATVPKPVPPTAVPRCPICGSTEIDDAAEFCRTCSADRDPLARERGVRN